MSSIAYMVQMHPVFGKFGYTPDFELNTATLLIANLNELCQLFDKPLVLLFDEVDCLGNGTLISFLRQLRDGYINREDYPFPRSIALVGMRNIRDYKARVRDDGKTLGSASPGWSMPLRANVSKRSWVIHTINLLLKHSSTRLPRISSSGATPTSTACWKG
ncbi:MAG: hypothetical protein PHI28_13410 [Mangrovibacterium sp.]|nr:hypothetical protein [Mangrovibacterium sp.]